MLIVSCWTSFLNPYFLYDSSVWCVLGKGLTEGLLPYRDIFDHKGCYLYAFYAAAACFGNIKVGLTVLLTILLTVDSLFVYRIARLFLSGKGAWCIVALFYVLLSGLIGNGGCVEEISLPFLLWPIYRLLYLCIKQNILRDIRKRDFVIIGFCGGIHAMLRMNNAGCLVGGTIFLFLYLLYHRRMTIVCQGLGLAIAGFIAALLPGILYFAWHDALYDMWYGSVLFNFAYAGTNTVSGSWPDKLLPHTYLLALAVAVFVDRKHTVLLKSAQAFILFVAMIGALAISIGKDYAHYAICILPACIIASSYALSLVCRLHKPWLNASAYTFLCVILIGPYTPLVKGQLLSAFSTLLLHYEVPCETVSQSDTYRYIHRYATCNREILTSWVSLIPENEKKSFLAYGCFGDVYMYMDLLPEYKYGFIQDAWALFSAGKITPQLEEHFSKNPPLWLLVCTSAEKNNFFRKSIAPNYRPVRESGLYSLMRYNK